MSSPLLEGRVVFITGAGGGIGRECALACAREGARVVVVDVDPDRARETAGLIGAEALPVQCDVTDRGSVECAIAGALDHFGRLDAVHNNAGISGPAAPLHQTAEEDWDLLHRTNLKSVYLTTRFALPALIASRGSILNTASMVGIIGQVNHAAYVATKGGMIALTKAMALDYAPLGIRVNAICPAGVWTPMLRSWAGQQPDPQAASAYLAHIHALGYCPEPDVVADTAVFLLSDKARFLTGCILPVSGGAELGYRR